tara:strand:+ start:8881 stop:9372 length:492 start_codon:yes stop_codon:yes gene_type:complete
MAFNHQRVLVSNLGDGNWGDGTENNLNTAAGTSVYFPPGAAKGTQPTADECFFGNLDYIGWNSKTNWMVQVDDATGAAPYGWNGSRVSVYVGRPSGVEELIVASAAADFTFGGIGGEEVYGPITYIRFRVDTLAATPTGLLCFVTAWNYGDIIDGTAPTISLP